MSGVTIEHARDISDDTFLAAVRKAIEQHPGLWASRWEVQAILAGFPDWRNWGMDLADVIERRVPGKVVLAKMHRLIGRDLISGCACGCRGDIELTELLDPITISPAVRDQYRALANVDTPTRPGP